MVLKKCDKFTLVEARIFTGRTHQIRIHLAHLGFPIVGEEWYGSKPCELHPRQLLHAYEVVFETGERFVAKVADDFVEFWGEEIEAV